MQTRNKILDDISQLMSNAMGVAQGAKVEAETAIKGWIDRWMAERDLVTREEFEAVRTMAERARTENVALKARIDALEQGIAAAPKPAATTARKPGVAKSASKPATKAKPAKSTRKAR